MQKISLLGERENKNESWAYMRRSRVTERRIITLLLTKANKTVVTVTRQRQAIWDFAGSSVEEC